MQVQSVNSKKIIQQKVYITRVHQHCHLGLSSTLGWDKQISTTVLKANGKLAVLRSVKFLARATLDLLYKLTVRSVLEYGMIVYFHSLTQVQLLNYQICPTSWYPGSPVDSFLPPSHHLILLTHKILLHSSSLLLTCYFYLNKKSNISFSILSI